MGRVVAIANQKGGVAKTTTAVTLAIALAREGVRTLLMDLDPQTSATLDCGYPQPDSLSPNVASIFEKEANNEEYDSKEFAVLHQKEGIDLIPGSIETSGIELALINEQDRELVLRQYVNKVRDQYDYIIIDSMPSLGLLTVNALAAADSVIIPVQAAYLSIKGLEQLLSTIEGVKHNLNAGLKIDGILITMIDERTIFAREVVELLEESFKDRIKVFKNRIPFSVRVAEASAEGVSIFQHDPKGKVAEAYDGFFKEVILAWAKD